MIASVFLWTLLAAVARCCISIVVDRGPWSSAKAQTYLFDFLFHASTTAAGLWAFFQLPHQFTLTSLLDDRSGWWHYQEAVTEASSIAPFVFGTLRSIVHANAGYYIFSFWLVSVTTARIDMLSHHFVSALMALIGAYSRAYLPAVVVVVAHNASDVFLLLGKLWQMRQTRTFRLLSDISFYAFLTCWMPTRLYFIPRYLAWPIVATNPIRLENPTFIVLVCVILVVQTLHCYWSFMILRLAYRKITHSGYTRTDDEDFVCSEKQGNICTQPNEN